MSHNVYNCEINPDRVMQALNHPERIYLTILTCSMDIILLIIIKHTHLINQYQTSVCLVWNIIFSNGKLLLRKLNITVAKPAKLLLMISVILPHSTQEFAGLLLPQWVSLFAFQLGLSKLTC